MPTLLTLHLLGRDVIVMLPPDSLRKGYFLFLHGSLLSPRDYTRYLEIVARDGYVVVAPAYNMHVFADAERYGSEAIAILDSVRAIYGDGEACVGGHSMGAYIGLKIYERFKCAVFLSLYLPFGSVDSIRIPVLLFSGGRDVLTPYPFHQRPLFERATSDRAMVLIPEATHNAYLNGPVWGDFMAGWPPFGQKRFYDHIGKATVRFLNGYLTSRGRPRATGR